MYVILGCCKGAAPLPLTKKNFAFDDLKMLNLFRPSFQSKFLSMILGFECPLA